MLSIPPPHDNHLPSAVPPRPDMPVRGEIGYRNASPEPRLRSTPALSIGNDLGFCHIPAPLFSSAEPQLPRSLEAYPMGYVQSRQRFLDQIGIAGGEVHSRQISAKGPQGEALHIDIGVIGRLPAKKVILHCAGVHGIEGFVGSAVQSEILRAVPVARCDTALVFVHCLNPWGMAHLRRANEENIDINRNFLSDEAAWSGMPNGYALLGSLLNPQRPSRFVDPFYAHVGFSIAKHGFQPLKQAVLQGQYEDPRGLMFGGKSRAESTVILDSWIRSHVRGAERIIGIDVHSGLGKFGKQILFIEHMAGDPRIAELQQAVGERLTPFPEGYHQDPLKPRGSLAEGVASLLQPARVDWFLQEFGTYPALRVLRALRDENFLHHYGTGEQRRSFARHYQEMFAPASLEWREGALRMGVGLMVGAMAALEGVDSPVKKLTSFP